jgi:hypothetical protein
MKRLSLLLICWCVFCRLSAAEFTVAAKIIDAGLTADGHQACVVQANVKNDTKAAIAVAMMTCSWGDSWRVVPEEAFEIPIWACDSNFPSRYVFQAGGGYSFRFLLQARTLNSSIEGSCVRVGFLFAKWDGKSPHLLMRSRNELAKVFPIVWSEEMTVPKVSDKVVYSAPNRSEWPNQAAEPTRTSVTPPAGEGDRAVGARGSP